MHPTVEAHAHGLWREHFVVVEPGFDWLPPSRNSTFSPPGETRLRQPVDRVAGSDSVQLRQRAEAAAVWPDQVPVRQWRVASEVGEDDPAVGQPGFCPI